MKNKGIYIIILILFALGSIINLKSINKPNIETAMAFDTVAFDKGASDLVNNNELIIKFSEKSKGSGEYVAMVDIEWQGYSNKEKLEFAKGLHAEVEELHKLAYGHGKAVSVDIVDRFKYTVAENDILK